ncbi:hypothetical protein KSP40_PGU004654 [Platanthera guangdongensis]|uniref:glutaredoxin-dependent peroxiredoxin n=1 Tax=Platanthera guangdongensis TaxID=2320717 RepID=A0ABR2MBP6_9ASPA
MGSAFLRPRVLEAAALRSGEAAATGSILCSRSFASLATGTDIVSAAQGANLQKSRSWDEGISFKFSTTPINEIFKGKKVVIFGLPGAFTGICSQHVPSYKNNFEKLKAKGIDSVVCVAVNDPYALNGWAEIL